MAKWTSNRNFRPSRNVRSGTWERAWEIPRARSFSSLRADTDDHLAMPRVIVERTFEAPLTQQELKATEARMAPCLDLYNVRWIRSYWSADRCRMVCEYDAADVASVRNVQREAEAKFDKAWAADVLSNETSSS